MPSTNANEYSLESKPVIDNCITIQFDHLNQSVPSMMDALALVNEYSYFIYYSKNLFQAIVINIFLTKL